MVDTSTPYGQAAAVLPTVWQSVAEAISEDVKQRAEEFRLRCGQPLSILLDGEEHLLSGPHISEDDLRAVLGKGSGYSVHSVYDQLCSGFLTLRGGHRIGICGEAVTKSGTVCGVRTISSLSIRIARSVETAGESVLETILDQGGRPESTLILAPPGAGKTTLLRDLIRRISDGIGVRACRVGLADQRREVSALWEGQAQLDVGRQTDIMTDCSKAEAAQILVRGMNPQIIAMDEITAEEDLEALLWAAGCGVTVLASAHGEGVESLMRRPLYRSLSESQVFSKLVTITQQGGKRTFHTERWRTCV